MESNFARENLSLPTMDKVTVLSIGHGQMTEKSFYELLQLNSVRVFAATGCNLLSMSTWNDCIAILRGLNPLMSQDCCRMIGQVIPHILLIS